ncbi:MAG: hypothetical protein ISR97_01540 [Nitrospira sp.]|nr:hypothetical protein [Nitrospira sp.]
MKRQIFMLLFVTFIITTGLVLYTPNCLLASGGESAPHGEAAAGHGAGHGDVLPGDVPYDKPVEDILSSLAPMTEYDLFPCSDCHDEEWETDAEKRDLDEPHDEIPGKFSNHDSENRWCLDCHSDTSRDKLRLINGNLIEFNEYYRVCEQCHKKVIREWKMGVHGKRTGNWNGEKQHWQCTQCHDPHNPPFKAVEPMPAPRRPLNIRTSDKAQASAPAAH